MSKSNDKDSSLTPDETRSINNALPKDQIPLLYAFRSDIRYEKISRQNSACALSRHFIGLFTHSKTGEPFELFAMIHISDIEMIYYSTDPFVLVQTKTTKLIANSKSSLKFAQLLYVICTVSYSYYPETRAPSLRSDVEKYFPTLNFHVPRDQFPIPLSFSQQFQFAYYANCSAHKIPYNHEVVRYINAMMLSANSIIDITQLPLDFTKEENSDDLIPIFNSLCHLNFTNGICCRNLPRPDILKSLEQLISNGNAVKIIHIENCGASEGLEILAPAVKFNPELEISYWNLSNNQLLNFKSFCTIITYSKHELLYLNLSNCGIKSPDSEELFTVLFRNARMHKIKHLYIAGFQFSNLDSFEKYLSRNMSIETLDLSQMSSMVPEILSILVSKNYKLRTLILNQTKLSSDALKSLTKFLKETDSLLTLDISATKITPQSVISIITTIAENPEIKLFNLNLNNLKLNDAAILLLYRVFLNHDLSKWKSLSFDENNMSENDLHNFLPLLIRMPNLEAVSFSGNFNSDMQHIHSYIVDILKIPSLKSLTISGNKTNKLGSQILPLLKRISEIDKLEYLDISNNSAGELTFQSVTQIIYKCKKLQKLFIDGSEFISVDQIESIVNSLQKNNSNIISMPFPVSDSQRMVGGNSDDNNKEMIRTLGELQMAMVQAINANRTKKKMPNDLPFPANEEITQLIGQISHGTRERIRKIIPKTHSGIAEFFLLPLPFQKMGDLVKEGGFIENLDIGDLATYEISSMNYAIVENKKTFQTCICPTMFITRMLNEPPPKPDDAKTNTETKTGNDNDTSDDSRYRNRNHKNKMKKKPNYSSDSQSDSQDDSQNDHQRRNYKKKINKRNHSSADDYDDIKHRNRKEKRTVNSSDNDSNDSELRYRKRKAQINESQNPKGAKKKLNYSDDDEIENKIRNKSKPRKLTKKNYDDDSGYSSQHQKNKKKKNYSQSTSDSNSSEDVIDYDRRKQKDKRKINDLKEDKYRNSKNRKNYDSDDDYEQRTKRKLQYDDSDDYNNHKKIKSSKPQVKKRNCSDDSDDSKNDGYGSKYHRNQRKDMNRKSKQQNGKAFQTKIPMNDYNSDSYDFATRPKNKKLPKKKVSHDDYSSDSFDEDIVEPWKNKKGKTQKSSPHELKTSKVPDNELDKLMDVTYETCNVKKNKNRGKLVTTNYDDLPVNERKPSPKAPKSPKRRLNVTFDLDSAQIFDRNFA